MKKDIHPKYMECEVHCGCGATWTTSSTVPKIRTEICSQCHPFFTGAERIVDALGRVDRFAKKFGTDYFRATPNKKPRAQRH